MVIVILISLLSTSFLLVFFCGKKAAKPVPASLHSKTKSVQADPLSASKVASDSGITPKQPAPVDVKVEKEKPPDNEKNVDRTQYSELLKVSKETTEQTGRDKSKKGASSKKMDPKKVSKEEASKMGGKEAKSAELSAASLGGPPPAGGAADDGGYEDCPDLSPEELAKIAAGGGK